MTTCCKNAERCVERACVPARPRPRASTLAALRALPLPPPRDRAGSQWPFIALATCRAQRRGRGRRSGERAPRASTRGYRQQRHALPAPATVGSAEHGGDGGQHTRLERRRRRIHLRAAGENLPERRHHDRHRQTCVRATARAASVALLGDAGSGGAVAGGGRELARTDQAHRAAPHHDRLTLRTHARAASATAGQEQGTISARVSSGSEGAMECESEPPALSRRCRGLNPRA